MAVQYGLQVITPPTIRPVQVPDCLAHMRIDEDVAEVAYIEGLIDAAVDYIENETMLTLCPTQYKLILDQFPFYVANRVVPYDYKRGAIFTVRNPLISVDEFTYVDNDGNTNTLTTPTDYQVASKQMPARVMPARGKVFPFADYYGVDSVQLTFTAGYAVGKVPPMSKHAVKLLVAHFYENREALSDKTLTDIPHSLRTMINKMRYMGFV